MRSKIRQLFLMAGMLLFILSTLGVITSLAIEGNTWQLMIIATGQIVDPNSSNEINESEVVIGLGDPNWNIPCLPPYPSSFKCTVFSKIVGDGRCLFKDMRQIGLDREEWILSLEIGPDADPNLTGYYPVLSWEPYSIGAGTLELRRGDTGDGYRLVSNMRDTNTYQSQGDDASNEDPNDRILKYTLVFLPVKNTYYHDQDGDGFGDPNDHTEAVIQPDGYVSDHTDCDDVDKYTNPEAAEICDGKDNDCDAIIPDNEADGDGDGSMICEGDCDDGNADVYPGAAEIIDGEDNDCDGETDEEVAIPNPPGISSVPPSSAKVGDEYLYEPTLAAGQADSWSLDTLENTPPDDMSLDPNTGRITWTPDENQIGDHEITLIVVNAGGSDSQTWTISAGPSIVSVPSPSAKTGEEYTYFPEVLGMGDITWSLIQKPEGMSVDEDSGHLTWVPHEGQVQTHTVTLKVAVNGKEDSQTWTISAGPSIVSVPSASAKTGEEYTYSPEVLGQGTIIWSLIQKPEGMIIEEDSGYITWIPDEGQVQIHTVILKVAVNGKEDSQSWMITVDGSSGGRDSGCFLSLF